MAIDNALKDKISSIAQAHPDGFTFNLFKGTLQNRGYAVAKKETQDSFGNKGLFNVLKYIKKNPKCCLGVWRNEEGTMQFDASMVYSDIKDAIRSAVENRQRAIFNLYTGKAIMAEDYSIYLTAA